MQCLKNFLTELAIALLVAAVMNTTAIAPNQPAPIHVSVTVILLQVQR